MIIQKGEQYIIPIKIKQGSQVVTPADVTDVRIQVGEYLKEYSKDEISFNIDTQEWEFPLTQEMTVSSYELTVPVQVGIKDNNNIFYSATDMIFLGESAIKKVW